MVSCEPAAKSTIDYEYPNMYDAFSLKKYPSWKSKYTWNWMPPEHFALSITQLLRAVFMPGREDCGDGGDSGDSGELIAWCIPHLDK